MKPMKRINVTRQWTQAFCQWNKSADMNISRVFVKFVALVVEIKANGCFRQQHTLVKIFYNSCFIIHVITSKPILACKYANYEQVLYHIVTQRIAKKAPIKDAVLPLFLPLLRRGRGRLLPTKDAISPPFLTLTHCFSHAICML